MTDVLFEAESKIAVARAIGSIVVGNRLRRLDEAKVTAFMDSIRKDGLRTPITVFGEQDAETARLSAGGHRLEACRRLGMAGAVSSPFVTLKSDWLDRSAASLPLCAMETSLQTRR